MANPLNSMIVTSPFGYRQPVNGSNFTTGSHHSGVDLRAATGTPVYAAAAGKVVELGRNHKAWGNYVIVESAGGYRQRYAHLHTVNVASKQQVNEGQQLGTAGATGNVTGSHLHFGVTDSAGAAISPLDWLNSLQSNKSDSKNNLPAFEAVGDGVYKIATGASNGKAAAAIIAGAAALMLLGVVNNA